jgi:hypothetical protein
VRARVPAWRGRGRSPTLGSAFLALFAPCWVGLAACSSDRPSTGASPARAGAGAGTAGSGASVAGAGGAHSNGGSSIGGAPSAGAPGAITPSSFVPARVRRLAAAEYDASVRALLATEQHPASAPDFPPDLRQDGFTVNDAQRVDAVIIERLAAAAAALASEARTNGTLARLAPCVAGDDAATCARSFITSFGAKVYRRPLLAEEASALFGLYTVGSDGTAYEDGVELVLRGLLQSAGFLYVTEIGTGELTAEGLVALTPHELAASLALLLTSAPPDDELARKASAGLLSDPAEREAEARRLFQQNPLAQATVVRLVREWLGIDGIRDSAKDSILFSEFASEKPRIIAESEDFVRAVAFASTGTVSELLGATWTVNSGPLSLYRPVGSGPVADSSALSDRVGILNQAAFLATYANAQESHPIFRGVALARRVICQVLDSPASLDIEVVPPAPDPEKTTRERFSVHRADPICAGCHEVIDPLGFAFEHFDAMGRYRELDNGRPVDSAVAVAVEAGFDGPYADSNELARALATSDTVRECFARFMFRAASATGDAAATPGEKEFVDYWRTLPEAAGGSIVETLIAYVKGPGFGLRRQP